MRASGYECGEHGRIRWTAAQSVSSRAPAGVQEYVIPLLGPDIWGELGRCGEMWGDIPLLGGGDGGRLAQRLPPVEKLESDLAHLQKKKRGWR